MRVPLCQDRQLWHHPVLQQLKEGGGGEGEEQQPVNACPSEPTNIYSSSSSRVCRSISSAAQPPPSYSLFKALSSPHYNVGFQVPLCHLSIIIHFFSLPYCCLICSMDSDPRKLTQQPRRITWLCTSRNCCYCWTLPGNCVWIMYWKCPWQRSCFGVPYTPWEMLNLLKTIKNC